MQEISLDIVEGLLGHGGSIVAAGMIAALPSLVATVKSIPIRSQISLFLQKTQKEPGEISDKEASMNIRRSIKVVFYDALSAVCVILGGIAAKISSEGSIWTNPADFTDFHFMLLLIFGVLFFFHIKPAVFVLVEKGVNKEDSSGTKNNSATEKIRLGEFSFNGVTGKARIGIIIMTGLLVSTGPFWLPLFLSSYMVGSLLAKRIFLAPPPGYEGKTGADDTKKSQ